MPGKCVEPEPYRIPVMRHLQGYLKEDVGAIGTSLEGVAPVLGTGIVIGTYDGFVHTCIAGACSVGAGIEVIAVVGIVAGASICNGTYTADVIDALLIGKTVIVSTALRLRRAGEGATTDWVAGGVTRAVERSTI